MRTLSWKPHLGSVTLDVELEDRVLTDLTVSPIHAAIILHFQDKSQYTETLTRAHTLSHREEHGHMVTEREREREGDTHTQT